MLSLPAELLGSEFEWSSDQSGARVTPLSLDTKYYAAHCDIYAIEPPSDVNDRNWPPAELRQCQAVIFVFDVENPDSFDVIQQAMARVCAVADPAVRICVANEPRHCTLTEDQRVARHRDCLLACLDSEVEFTPMSFGANAAAVAGGSSSLASRVDELDGDSVGAARVREALECHTWMHMLPKSRADAMQPREGRPVRDSSINSSDEADVQSSAFEFIDSHPDFKEEFPEFPAEPAPVDVQPVTDQSSSQSAVNASSDIESRLMAMVGFEDADEDDPEAMEAQFERMFERVRVVREQGVR
jgi:hypothetical protein